MKTATRLKPFTKAKMMKKLITKQKESSKNDSNGSSSAL